MVKIGGGIRPFSSDISTFMLIINGLKATMASKFSAIVSSGSKPAVEHCGKILYCRCGASDQNSNRNRLKGGGLGDPPVPVPGSSASLCCPCLFAIRFGLCSALCWTGNDVRLLNEFSGLSVPYATVIDDQRVLAQRPGRSGSFPFGVEQRMVHRGTIGKQLH